MVLVQLTGNGWSFSNHPTRAPIFTITKETIALSSSLSLGLITSAFGRVRERMAVRQTAIWQNCDLKMALSSADNPLNLPKPKPLPGRSMLVPYVLTGDDAFALTRYLMKPFPLSGLSRAQRVFNYRLFCMRRISENGLGIIGNRSRVFRTPILLPPDKVIALIMVALVLHNFLR